MANERMDMTLAAWCASLARTITAVHNAHTLKWRIRCDAYECMHIIVLALAHTFAQTVITVGARHGISLIFLSFRKRSHSHHRVFV